MKLKQQSIINNFSTKIDSNIYLFLYKLFKDIFLNQTPNKKVKNNYFSLNNYLNIVNQKIILKKEKYLSTDYSIENMKNIVDFVISQNRIYAADIIEGILISIFSLGFEIDRGESINKYIFNNLSEIKDKDDFFFIYFFKKEKFKAEELKNIRQLLEKENSINDYCNYMQKSPLFNLLYAINKEKYKQINVQSKFISIQNSDSFSHMNKLINSLEDSKNIYEKDMIINSILKLSSVYLSNNFGNKSNYTIGIIKAFFISVFIYYQNKNSPLMNFIKSTESKKTEFNEKLSNNKFDNKNKLVKVPFISDFNEACIEGRFANIVIAPIRMETRITNIKLSKNNLRELGIYELNKALLFNKSIKSIECTVSIVRSFYLDYILLALRLFDNFTVEKLNLSWNHLKEDCGDSLGKIISHFKGLKSLNLSSNDLKGGLSSFFIALKKLYRKGKTKLEILYLNNCKLDDSSYYELGELIKCKYCKLKKLCLNKNKIPLNANFLKKLKKNKSLTDLYMNENKINNKDVDNINRVISNTNIQNLYLYENNITDCNEFLRIIYRTKLIKDDINRDMIKTNSILMNLDLSENIFSIKNLQHIKLLTTIIDETTLSCLDISRILLGKNPDKYEKVSENAIYPKSVENLKKN